MFRPAVARDSRRDSRPTGHAQTPVGESGEGTLAPPTITVKLVNDPNYLSPAAWQQARDLSARLIDQESDEDVYWRGVEMQALVSGHLPDDAPGRFYVVWAELTDLWELDPARRPESVALLREASTEFMALDESPNDLDAYLTRWQERLRQI